jgi:ribosomal protein S18 acetylase RimI-like enzyme
MKDQPITIRPARPEDANAVTAIWTVMAEQHREFDPVRWNWSEDAPAQWREWFLMAVGKEEMIVLVAADESDTPIGYLMARLGVNPPTFAITSKAEVFDLVVKNEYQRRGIGTRLMQEAAALLKDRGAQEMTLSVATANTPAIAFYEKFGMHTATHQMYARL